jgi:hypothetical protein
MRVWARFSATFLRLLGERPSLCRMVSAERGESGPVGTVKLFSTEWGRGQPSSLGGGMRSGGGDPGDVGYSSSASTSISMSEGRAVTRGSSTLNTMEDSGVGGVDMSQEWNGQS